VFTLLNLSIAAACDSPVQLAVSFDISRSSTAVLTVAAVAAAAAATDQAVILQTSSVNFNEQFVNFNSVMQQTAALILQTDSLDWQLCACVHTALLCCYYYYCCIYKQIGG
jgi:hypothetical protein